MGVDAVGSLVAGAEGQGRDEAGVQGHRCGLQLPARATGAHLEHPGRAQQQLAQSGAQDFRRRVIDDRKPQVLNTSMLDC